VTTISQHCSGKGANVTLALSVSGASRSRLCLVALMGLAFIHLALPTFLAIYVQKSDFYLINVLCEVIVVKNVGYCV